MSDDAKLIADLRALDAEVWWHDEDYTEQIANALPRLLDLADEALRSRAVVEAAREVNESWNGGRQSIDAAIVSFGAMTHLCVAIDTAAAKGGAS